MTYARLSLRTSLFPGASTRSASWVNGTFLTHTTMSISSSLVAKPQRAAEHLVQVHYREPTFETGRLHRIFQHDEAIGAGGDHDLRPCLRRLSRANLGQSLLA